MTTKYLRNGLNEYKHTLMPKQLKTKQKHEKN